MSQRCVIISGGEYAKYDGFSDKDYVIACDKGYAHAKKMGARVDLALGDFDSYAGTVDKSVPVEKLRPEKDDTDTMAAVRRALDRGYTNLLFLCALGGRVDHMLSNIQTLLFAAKRGARCELRDEKNDLLTLCNDTMVLKKRAGRSLSLFSLTDECSGVSVRGAKYPLENAVLTNSFPLGVSNEWISDEAEITVKQGVLLIVLSEVS